MKDYNKLYRVSRSYAQSLFEVIESDQLNKIFDQFSLIIEILKNSQISYFIFKYNISSTAVEKFIHILDSNLEIDVRLKNLLILLFKNNKIKIIKTIFECFRNLTFKELGYKHLIITFAHQQGTKFADDITAKLEQQFKTKFLTEIKINNNLLSGFTYQIDSMFFNASLDSMLKKYQKNIYKQLVDL